MLSHKHPKHGGIYIFLITNNKLTNEIEIWFTFEFIKKSYDDIKYFYFKKLNYCFIEDQVSLLLCHLIKL